MKFLFNYLKSRILGYMLFLAPDKTAASLALSGSNLASPQGASLASAAQVVITNAIHPLTGTTQLTTVKIPTGFRGVFGFVCAAGANGATGGTYAASDGVNETIPFAVGWVSAANKLALFYTDGLKAYPLVLTAAA
jgi:hypothetical protein